jgi:hypothetical protein
VDLRTAAGPRLFVHLSAADERGRQPQARPFDASRIDVAQAFVEVPLGSAADFRLGRKELDLDANRLVSLRDVTAQGAVQTGRVAHVPMQDALFSNSGRSIGLPAGSERSGSLLLGDSARWTLGPHLELYVSYVHAFALAAVRDRGGSDVDYGMTQLTARFQAGPSTPQRVDDVGSVVGAVAPSEASRQRPSISSWPLGIAFLAGREDINMLLAPLRAWADPGFGQQCATDAGAHFHLQRQAQQ